VVLARTSWEVRNHAFRRRGHRVRRDRQTLDDILVVLLVHALRAAGTPSDDVSQSIARRASKFIARLRFVTSGASQSRVKKNKHTGALSFTRASDSTSKNST
jgi:hypothetical protein